MSLVYGVGINDLQGETGDCPYYKRWTFMLRRCYCRKYQIEKPTYIGCSVCDEWLIFSNFKRWMLTKDWEGKHLDKDIIVNGNKVYSPETCVFIDRKINTFTHNKFISGSTYVKSVGKFRVKISNPITGKCDHGGYFESYDEVMSVYKSKKLILLKELLTLTKSEFLYGLIAERILN